MRLLGKENGPVFIILVMVLLVSAATLTGGIVSYMEEGMTDNALILILFGSIVFLFVTLAFVITLCTEPLPHQRPTRLPYSDSPPKYRETWRRQHLESLSQATDTYTGETSLEAGGTTVTNLSRLDARSLWRPAAIPGVHETPRRTRTTSVSVISTNQGDLGISSSRSGRANTDPHIWVSDDGLPSYEEALRN